MRCQLTAGVLLGSPSVKRRTLLDARLLQKALGAVMAWMSPLDSKLLLGAANPAESKKAPMGKAFALSHVL